eukprot:79264_1
MGCATSVESEETDTEEKAATLVETKKKKKLVSSIDDHCDFMVSIRNISSLQLSEEKKKGIIVLFSKYAITKQMFLRASPHDIKELMMTNIPCIHEHEWNTVYYAIYHCDKTHDSDEALDLKKGCGILTVSSGSVFHLRSDTIFEYESICLEEDSALTTKPWNEETERGGTLFLNCLSNIVLKRNATIDVSGLGYDFEKKKTSTDDVNVQTTKTTSEPFELRIGYGSKEEDKGRGGGTVKIHCRKLIMYEGARIIANGEMEEDGQGGTIFIDCDNILMEETAKIHANNGQIGLSVSTLRFAQQFVSNNEWQAIDDHHIMIPDDVLELIIKYWGFLSNDDTQQIQPKPQLFLK